MKNILVILLLLLMAAQGIVSQSFTEVQRLRINTKEFSEYGALIFNGKMYFCSNRKTSLTVNATDGNKIQYYYDIFEINDTSTFHFRKVGFPVNTDANDGPICFGNDSLIYVSRNFAEMPGKKEKTKVGIFWHKKLNNEWSSIWSDKVPFEYNNPVFNTGHPSISADGKLMFFTSDRPGGNGGYDIYYCRLENGTWSEPVNAGKNVNGPWNEVFPFFHSSGSLYFSSNRDTASGYDIYSSLFENMQFGSVVKLDSPINSTSHDFSFYCDATTESGFFASDREGSDDIFRFRSTFPVFENCDSVKANNYCFTFFEENSYNLDTLPMYYEWDFGDIKIKEREADYCFPGPGTYEVSLNIIDSLTGDVYQNQASYIMNIEDAVQPVITLPEKFSAGTGLVFSAEKSNLPGYEVMGYYWRFNDGAKYSGLSVIHSFPKPGKQTVWLGVVLKDTLNNVTLKKCVFRDFDVVRGR